MRSKLTKSEHLYGLRFGLCVENFIEKLRELHKFPQLNAMVARVGGVYRDF